MSMKFRMLYWLLPAAVAMGAAQPALALSTKECGVKYRAAKKDGTLGTKNWAAFRKAECGEDAKASSKADDAKPGSADKTKPASADKAKPAEPKVATGPAVFPAAIASKYATEKPAKQRFHTCLDQYRTNKTTGGNGGLRWVEKGGGYLSQCSKKLKS